MSKNCDEGFSIDIEDYLIGQLTLSSELVCAYFYCSSALWLSAHVTASLKSAEPSLRECGGGQRPVATGPCARVPRAAGRRLSSTDAQERLAAPPLRRPQVRPEARRGGGVRPRGAFAPGDGSSSCLERGRDERRLERRCSGGHRDGHLPLSVDSPIGLQVPSAPCCAQICLYACSRH